MEKEKSIYKKLLLAQKGIGSVKKTKENPFFASKYADINAYIDEVKPIINECGLIILQPFTVDNGENILKTIIVDADTGEEIKSVLILPKNPDSQKMGAIITYFRRYAIQSLLFLQAEDDDANSVNQNKTQYEKVGNKTVAGNTEVPHCSICGKLMKPTKPGSKTKFYCKHGNEWGKPVFPEKEVIVEEENPF